MAPSFPDAFALLAHELAHPLARMGSEADVLALKAVKELERAYGPGPRFEAAKSKVMLQRGRIREAHEAAEGALRQARLFTEADRGWIALHFRPVRLSFLVEGAVKRSPFRAADISVEGPDGHDEVVCDEDLMQVALRNLLLLGFKWRSFPGELRVRLRREAENVVVSLPWSIPLSDGLLESDRLLDMNDLNIFLAKRILELHDGTLRRTESGVPETEIRWPYGLTPGLRRPP
jgi:hypothetical protein